MAQFMASTNGRIIRIVVGIVLIALGLAVVGGTGGIILAIVGLAPIGAGVFDICLIGPLFGAGSIQGKDIRGE